MFALTRTLSKKFSRGIDNVFLSRSAKKENEVDEIEKQVTRYKPEGLDALCRSTKFSRKELQIMYRGFKNSLDKFLLDSRLRGKARSCCLMFVEGSTNIKKSAITRHIASMECPTGIVNEDTFKYIYAQFFPQGDCSAYAHYVFNTFDQDHSGTISFEEFVMGLSLLLRGSLHEKLQWAFSLYDINGDGVITSDEMVSIITSVYDIMGKFAEPRFDEKTVREHAEFVFEKMDADRDGVISLDEFIESCRKDEDISRSMVVFDTVL